MKKIILIASLFLMGMKGYSQAQEENGIIYIKHPYIDVVNSTVKAYMTKDVASFAKIYSDTAKWWASGMEKPMPIAAAFKEWASDFDYYTDIKITPVGYPDYLHYKDKDQKYVQSWWLWEGRSKKTGGIVKIDMVQFDSFNSAGKIVFESNYGDFSKMVKN